MERITVEYIIEALKDYRVSMLAGSGGIKNEISSVSVLELSSWDKEWLCGGELILSTLSAFRNPIEIAGAIGDFAQSGVAALAVHPVFRDEQADAEFILDEEILKAAEKYAFPILSIPYEVTYSSILSTVYRFLHNKQLVRLLKSEQANNLLTEALLTGGNAETIARILGKFINAPVIIFDDFNRQIAKSERTDLEKKVVSNIEQEHYEIGKTEGNAISAFFPTDPPTVHIDRNTYTPVLHPVQLGNDSLGSIIVWIDQTEDAFEEQMIHSVLSHAATALSLIEMKRKAALDSFERLKYDFYYDLLNDKVNSDDALFMRADYLGIAITDKHRAFVVDFDNFKSFVSENAGKGEIFIQNIRQNLNRVLKWALYQIDINCTIIPITDGYVALLHTSLLHNEREYKNKLVSACEYIHSNTSYKLHGLTVTIGIGDVQNDIQCLRKSFDHAKKAIQIGRKTIGFGGYYFYDDMSLYKLLLVDSIEELHLNCQAELSALTSANDKNSSILLQTLEVYLDSNESLLTTANILDIHTNTVKYRVDKIKSIIGDSYFTNNEEKLKLHVAIKMLKVF